MSQRRKSKTTVLNAKFDERYVHRAAEGSHPSQVSGMFKDDPTFAEFREILHKQRKEVYRRANEKIVARTRKEGKAKRCSFSTPMP
ncbi:MAG: hypothetical protein HY268_16215 [Deltaproteobacteria bacterium]|nr:hypothetical protein [Deltaproteobacteria bacterium]